MLLFGLFVLLKVCVVPVAATTHEDCAQFGYWPGEGYDYSFSGGFPNVNGQTGHVAQCLYKQEGNWDSVTTVFNVPSYLEITALSSGCSIVSNVVTCSENNIPKVEYFIDTKVKPDTPIGTCSWPTYDGEPYHDGPSNIWSCFWPKGYGDDIFFTWGGSCVVKYEPPRPTPEFPSMFLPTSMIIGFLGAVLFIQRTREH